MTQRATNANVALSERTAFLTKKNSRGNPRLSPRASSVS
jgi:hypothetical protein